MTDEHKQYASTAVATLEAHILSVHSAKSEAEWWAHREIERLRAENEKLRAALKMIAETYNKPTTSKDGLAFIAAAALKETGGD